MDVDVGQERDLAPVDQVTLDQVPVDQATGPLVLHPSDLGVQTSKDASSQAYPRLPFKLAR